MNEIKFEKYDVPIGKIVNTQDLIEYEQIRFNEINRMIIYFEKVKKQHKKNIEKETDNFIIEFEKKRLGDINQLLVKFNGLKLQHRQNLNDLKFSEELAITDHCIIRYIQRVLGIKIEPIKSELMSEQLKKLFKTFGDGVYYKNGYGIVIQGGNLVTILYDKNVKRSDVKSGKINTKIKYRCT